MPAPTSAATHTSGASTRAVSVLLYSDDVATRDAVRVGVGRRPAKDVEISSWHECATAAAVIEAVESGAYDLVLLDGEAAPTGGLGLCRQLKNEIFRCPPIIVLTGRPQDGWLASWSQAEAAVPHPLDPLVLANTVADVVRKHVAAS
ncbi:response regulator transcription factor [Demetria terragena]|uniref:response regulator transcription factor n=1 Tax=Demetria terragena TaxID=63959 RepID=UPI00037D9A10|nr:response regulator transcription factor [Demetria terragena]